MTDTEKRATAAASVGKGPRARKPRRRRRMLTGVSRQRRAANARERRRIQGVNDAFVELKSKIPVVQPDDVSKIETLRLAAKWIAHLTTVLIQDDHKKTSCSESHPSLPKTLQDKFQDLLKFELEDFMLISQSLTANYAQDKQTFCQSKSNVNSTSVNSLNLFTDNSTAVYDSWSRPYHSEDITHNSNSSSSSSGSCSPSDLQYLDSCDVSPHALADDLGLSPYDLDLPPLATVFSQQTSPTVQKNHWSYFEGQYDAQHAIQTGYYR